MSAPITFYFWHTPCTNLEFHMMGFLGGKFFLRSYLLFRVMVYITLVIQMLVIQYFSHIY